MPILAAAPALLFGLGCLCAFAVLAVSGRRAFTAWGELKRSLDGCGDLRIVRVRYAQTGGSALRPRLRLVESAATLRPAVRRRALPEAA